MSAYLFYVSFAGLSIRLGLEKAGIGLGLEGAGFGLGLVTTGLDYNTNLYLFACSSCWKV